MYNSGICYFPFWWIIPLGMIVLCFFMMMFRKRPVLCGFRFRKTDYNRNTDSKSPFDILDSRFALGEITLEEYEKKKRILKETIETEKKL